MMGSLRRGPRSRSETANIIQAGFTIVETMIVIAITGVLFVAIVGTISARQNKVQFNQSINKIKGEIEAVINEVQSGRYPDSADYSCVVSGAVLDFNGPAVEQGTNQQCLALGKVMQFGNGFGSSPEQYAIFTIAGDAKAKKFFEAKPQVVPYTMNTKPLANGLTVAWICQPGGGCGPINGSIAITTYFENTGGTTKTSEGGQTAIAFYAGGRLGDSKDDSILNINNAFDYQPYEIANNNLTPTPGGVKICFKSGTTNQSALMVIGGKSGTSVVAMDVKQSPDCS